jgi:hypothetical protein
MKAGPGEFEDMSGMGALGGGSAPTTTQTPSTTTTPSMTDTSPVKTATSMSG